MFNLATLYAAIAEKVKPPVAVVLGSPQQAAELVSLCPPGDVVCYQLDLHQAGRLHDELQLIGRSAHIETKPDLWDLPAHFQTLLFPIAVHGERELKIDLLEQALRILKPRGLAIALSEYDRDQLLPKAFKKLFGKCHELPARPDGGVFWGVKEKEKPQRRHELSFHARIGEGPSHSFLSRPGVFSYGRMDDGALRPARSSEHSTGQCGARSWLRRRRQRHSRRRPRRAGCPDRLRRFKCPGHRAGGRERAAIV